jgi:hypothetical protein
MSSERETTQHIKFRVILYILIVIIYEQNILSVREGDTLEKNTNASIFSLFTICPLDILIKNEAHAAQEGN